MSELHWSERRELERMIRSTKKENQKTRQEHEAFAQSATPLALLNAIVALVERQRCSYANAALEDKSKYPQRLEGGANAFDALLVHDLYPIQQLMKESSHASAAIEAECSHNHMIANDDPKHVWKCADCGYVY